MSNHRNNKCEKPCKPECPKKECCTKYDSWCSSDSDCCPPKGYKRSYTVTEYVFKQQKNCGRRFGYKTRCNEGWQPVDCKDEKHCYKKGEKHIK